MAGNYVWLTSQPRDEREDAMFDAKRILKTIILKIATESLAKFKQDFLGLPLTEQKRILREHGLKQGVFSSGLHSLQKRLGYRNNNNSRKNQKFLNAQEKYFKATIEEKYNIIVSKLRDTEPDKSIKTILNFFDKYHSSIIDNPKKIIYEWLYGLLYKTVYPGIDRVFIWAIDNIFMGVAGAGALRAELIGAARDRRFPNLPSYPPPAPTGAAAAEEEDPAAAAEVSARVAAVAAPGAAVAEERGRLEAAERAFLEEGRETAVAAPDFGPGGENHESEYGGGSRRKSQRRRRRRRTRRTRRH